MIHELRRNNDSLSSEERAGVRTVVPPSLGSWKRLICFFRWV
jgi:hypothetical protein